MAGITLMDIIWIFLFENLGGLIVFAIWYFVKRRWNLPVVVLQYTGDKRRPKLMLRRARVVNKNGLTALFVKGYEPIRNFKLENYYPTPGAPAGLILFEFRKGWLTPVLPFTNVFPPELKEDFDRINRELSNRGVDFQFDENMYKTLMLKAVDDVDAEWYGMQRERQSQQYTGGWRDFLAKYGGHLLVVVVVVCLLVGFIVWMQKSPEMMGKCIDAGVQAARNTYLQEIAGKVGQGAAGVPPG